MDYRFDRDGFLYFIKFAMFTGIVIFLGFFAAREFEAYYFDFESEKISEKILDHAPMADIPAKPVYKELAKAESVFLPAKEVLVKFEEFKGNGENFIFADLNRMKLSYYRKGEEEASFGILSKGKEGSFFETPSGVYGISYKEENHFSTIGKVWMPWSLHFFGNYFIHGWPYYPNGRAVPPSFSGGCIRLSASDAKSFFKLVSPGTPLLIYSDSERDKELATVLGEDAYFRKTLAGRSVSPPKLSAAAYLAVDFENGQILLSQNEKMVYSIASITKLMTALVASEMYQVRTFKITKKALEEYGSSGGLKNGEIFETDELLYPLLLASSNDAAAVFELESGEFLPSMNKKARAIGLAATSFSDASGLTPLNVSTAEDLFKLLKYIYSHKKPIFDILSLKEYKLAQKNKRAAHVWENINRPKGSKNFIAGKIGYTDEASETSIGVYRLKLSEGGDRDIAIVVLHSRDHEEDTNKIAKYLGENFVYGNVLVKNKIPAGKPEVIVNEASVYEAVYGRE